MAKLIDLTGLTEYDSKLKEFLENNYIQSSNHTIKNIVELTYEAYRTLLNNDEIDPDTEYHIKENGTSSSGGGFDPEHIPGYDPTKVQVLKNVRGTLQWSESELPIASATEFGSVKMYVDSTDDSVYLSNNENVPLLKFTLSIENHSTHEVTTRTYSMSSTSMTIADWLASVENTDGLFVKEAYGPGYYVALPTSIAPGGSDRYYITMSNELTEQEVLADILQHGQTYAVGYDSEPSSGGVSPK